MAVGKYDRKLYVYSTNGFKSLIGNVDYDTGKISINNYEFKNNINLTKIPVVCVPISQNINISKNYLLRLSDLSITINEII